MIPGVNKIGRNSERNGAGEFAGRGGGGGGGGGGGQVEAGALVIA